MKKYILPLILFGFVLACDTSQVKDESHKNEIAFKELDTAQTLAPQAPEPSLLRCHILLRAGELKAARKQFQDAYDLHSAQQKRRKARNLKPQAGPGYGPADYQVELAAALALREHRYTQALKILTGAMKTHQESATFWINLGTARLQTADLSGAVRAYQRAYDIQPDPLLKASIAKIQKSM